MTGLKINFGSHAYRTCYGMNVGLREREKSKMMKSLREKYSGATGAQSLGLEIYLGIDEAEREGKHFLRAMSKRRRARWDSGHKFTKACDYRKR